MENLPKLTPTQVLLLRAAARLWWMLRWLGQERVAVLDGGIAAGKRAGGTLAAGHAVAAQGHFSSRAHHLCRSTRPKCCCGSATRARSWSIRAPVCGLLERVVQRSRTPRGARLMRGRMAFRHGRKHDKAPLENFNGVRLRPVGHGWSGNERCVATTVLRRSADYRVLIASRSNEGTDE
jgi:hypothetical protein